jgi:hypothetical protein
MIAEVWYRTIDHRIAWHVRILLSIKITYQCILLDDRHEVQLPRDRGTYPRHTSSVCLYLVWVS